MQEKPLHKKDPSVGTKKLVYSSNLIIEQEDAASFGDNEEVRLELYLVSVKSADTSLDHRDGLGKCFRLFQIHQCFR